MKTLKLFVEQTCQVFYELKRCASKNAVFEYNEKAGKSVPVASKRKMAENLHRIDRHRPKLGLNPHFLGCSKTAHKQGQIRIRDFIVKISSGKIFLHFLNLTRVRQKI